MREIAVDRAFADAFVPEEEAMEDAREAAHQFGIEPVSPAAVAPRPPSPRRQDPPPR